LYFLLAGFPNAMVSKDVDSFIWMVWRIFDVDVSLTQLSLAGVTFVLVLVSPLYQRDGDPGIVFCLLI
jgi:hypothetical protein